MLPELRQKASIRANVDRSPYGAKRNVGITRRSRDSVNLGLSILINDFEKLCRVQYLWYQMERGLQLKHWETA
jgi:hypothetical protein